MGEPDDQTSPKGEPHTGILDSRIDAALARRDQQTGGGGGGGTGGPQLDARVAKLEAHTEHMQSDLTEIRTMLGELARHVHKLPTKQDLTANLLGLIVIGLTIIVLAVGGIIGGLGWIAPKEPSAPAQSSPMIFQIPAPQAVQPVPVAPAAAPNAVKAGKAG